MFLITLFPYAYILHNNTSITNLSMLLITLFPYAYIIAPLLRIKSNHPIESQQSYKLLGIWPDENLSLDHHVKKLCNKLTRALFFLRRSQNFLTNSVNLSVAFIRTTE